jgi:uncharacterized protein YndB with AHSA1/START domain
VTEGVRVPPIELVLETHAAPDLAWRTLTEPERVALWLTTASRLVAIGQPYRLEFGEGSVVAGEVLELDPGRSFSHGWRWEGEPTDETRVTWTVEPRDGGSLIRLVHDGWREAGAGSPRDDHARYWAGYLDDLRDVLEEA